MSNTRKPPKRNKPPTPKPQPIPFKATALLDITIIGQIHFSKGQNVWLKKKIIKERDINMPETYLKSVKVYAGKNEDKTPLYKDTTVEAINLDETQTLIFIGTGGGTGKGVERTEKYNKWYSLSKEQEQSFSTYQLF